MPPVCPDAGTKIKVSASFSVVISSHDLQEYLYFIVFNVNFAILLKHFMFVLPGLGSLVLQTFTRVKSLGLKSCTKGPFWAHRAHIITQVGEMGRVTVTVRGQEQGGC